MAKTSYRRLPGRASSLLQQSTLWEGEDHLLLVESYIVSESYKRFHYRDIQAIVICGTKMGLVCGVIFGAITALLGAIAIFSGPETGLYFGIPSFLFLGLALYWIWHGPTCRTTLKTAVQSHPLRSLGSLRTARKVLRRLSPRIIAAQREQPPA